MAQTQALAPPRIAPNIHFGCRRTRYPLCSAEFYLQISVFISNNGTLHSKLSGVWQCGWKPLLGSSRSFTVSHVLLTFGPRSRALEASCVFHSLREGAQTIYKSRDSRRIPRAEPSSKISCLPSPNSNISLADWRFGTMRIVKILCECSSIALINHPLFLTIHLSLTLATLSKFLINSNYSHSKMTISKHPVSSAPRPIS
jgi:hypothetical protein